MLKGWTYVAKLNTRVDSQPECGLPKSPGSQQEGIVSKSLNCSKKFWIALNGTKELKFTGYPEWSVRCVCLCPYVGLCWLKMRISPLRHKVGNFKIEERPETIWRCFKFKISNAIHLLFNTYIFLQ